jgi:hypothetical protein
LATELPNQKFVSAYLKKRGPLGFFTADRRFTNCRAQNTVRTAMPAITGIGNSVKIWLKLVWKYWLITMGVANPSPKIMPKQVITNFWKSRTFSSGVEPQITLAKQFGQIVASSGTG